jgi:hypothetical protein
MIRPFEMKRLRPQPPNNVYQLARWQSGEIERLQRELDIALGAVDVLAYENAMYELEAIRHAGFEINYQ